MANSPASEAQSSVPAARKRKDSTDEGGPKRVIKHRSSQACQSCRVRKVRCDIVANGTRCTNCRLDRVDCVVLPSRRGKGHHTHRKDSTQRRQSENPSSTSPKAGSTPEQRRRHDDTTHEGLSPPLAPGGQVPTCVTFDQDFDTTASAQQLADDNVIGIHTDHAPAEAYETLMTPDTAGTNTLRPCQSPNQNTAIPLFITPLSKRILTEDLEFLKQKGALILPEPDLQLEILRGYLFSVHPFMPMLNFRSFLHAVMNNQEDNRISLLLFQAVMFAGLHSLPLHIIHRLGFNSTKQAREVFFDRVRLLYEFDVEPDSAAVLQSLILMSSWYSKWDDRRHTWHWTGLAYDLARSMGLHREPTARYASNDVRHFRRRLWWSLYIRDRLIALGTRRPMRIQDEDFDVAMLTLEDFDLEPMQESNHGQPLVPSATENTSTALMCMQLAKLCIRIGHVMSSQYTTLSPQSDVPHTMLVVSRRDDGRIEELKSCEEELDEWFDTLGSNLRTNDPATAFASPQSCSGVHWAMLNMTYLTAVNVLHRAQALQPLSDASDAQIAQKGSREKVKDTARRLTRLSQNMLRQDQVRFLGVLGVTALVAACLSHMLDISSGDEDVRDASTFRLYQSLQVLQVLRGIYASADAAASFLSSVTRTAGISTLPQIDTAASSRELIGRSADGRQGGDWRDVENLASRKLGSSNEPSSDICSDQHLGLSQMAHYPVRKPQEPLHLDLNSINAVGDLNNVNPATIAFVEPNSAASLRHRQSISAKDTPMTEHIAPQLDDTVAGALSNSAIDGTLFNWNNGVDAGLVAEGGTAFNYDFYSDAFGFGFLDGHLQGD